MLHFLFAVYKTATALPRLQRVYESVRVFVSNTNAVSCRRECEANFVVSCLAGLVDR